jgi:hypothetical protein
MQEMVEDDLEAGSARRPRKMTFLRSDTAWIVRGNAASSDEDEQFIVTPFSLLAVAILDYDGCRNLDRFVLMKASAAVSLFILLCLGVYQAAVRNTKEALETDPRALEIQDARDIYDLGIGMILIAILVERIKNQTMADFSWVASAKLEANPSSPYACRSRWKIWIVRILLLLTHLFIIWATGAILAGSSSINIYLNSFAVYFVLELDGGLLEVVRLVPENFHSHCTIILKELRSTCGPSAPSKCVNACWLLVWFFAEMDFVVSKFHKKGHWIPGL